VNEIRIGDCVELMRAMVAEGIRVQTCITSPPYYGLRDYGTASWEDGDPACDHLGGPRASEKSKLNGGRGQLDYERDCRTPFVGACGKCGAVRIDSQMGLEKSPAEYLEKMVDVFRLVRELLADDGTLWLNMGDSYASSTKGSGGPSEKQLSNAGSRYAERSFDLDGFKPKDLMGMPWRLAFALQADGWYLRSDIIWHKPNSMPESVTDRPTKSHEYIFLLSKSEQYFYDADAIREKTGNEATPEFYEAYKKPHHNHEHDAERGMMQSQPGRISMTNPAGRNKRSVWTVASEAYSEAHFATFPHALIVPCVLAGSRAGDIVFDPFMGSGTTALVAKENGRRYLGCELNPEYAKLQADRLRQEVLFSG